jgi:2-dehydropantoate 2-reductase
MEPVTLPRGGTLKSSSALQAASPSTLEDIRKVAIIGAGAMGSLFASKFSKVSDVWLVSSWEDHISAINSRGLVVENGGSSEIIKRVKATSNIDDVPSDIDLIVILVKSSQTEEAAFKASSLIKRSRRANVLTLQNGIGNYEVLETILNANRSSDTKVITIKQGVTDQGAFLVQPGVVHQTGLGVTTLAGDLNTGENKVLQRFFEQVGVNTQWVEDSDSVVWGKLVINAAINPLTALFNLRNGELYHHPQARNLMNQIIDEVLTVANAKGITLPYRNPHAKVEAILRATSDNTSSMLVDVQRGVRTEVEAINGAIVREAKRLGVRVPLNETLLGILKENGSFYSVNADAAA